MTNTFKNLGSEAVALVINTTNKIVDLNISHQNLIGDNFKKISSELNKNSTIETLSLNNTKLDRGAIESLVEGLRENKTINTLNLSHNDFSDDALIPFFKIIRYGSYVTAY